MWRLGEALDKGGGWCEAMFGGPPVAKSVIQVKGGRSALGRTVKGESSSALPTTATAYYNANTVPINRLLVFVGLSPDLTQCNLITGSEQLRALISALNNQVPKWTNPIPALVRPEADEKESAFASAHGGKGLEITLQRLYPEYPLLEFNGEKVAATVFEAHELEWNNIEAPLIKPLGSTKVPPDNNSYDVFHFDPEGEGRFLELKNKERANPKRYWNGVTYDMERLEITKQSCKLHCKVGRYFLQSATADFLETELITKLARDPHSEELKLEHLPRRKWLHDRLTLAGVESPICNGSFRCAAIGISTLTLFYNRNAKCYCFLIHPRSGTLLTYKYLLHIVPSGMFQPIFESEDEGDLNNEYTVAHNIFREYYEEVYDNKDVRRSEDKPHATWFYDEPPLQTLFKMFATNREEPSRGAKLYYTGLAVDLLNLKVDICALLVIREPDWFEQYITGEPAINDPHRINLSEEYLRLHETHLIPKELESFVNKVKVRMKLDRSLNLRQPELLRPRYMLPTTCAVIDLGLKVARRIIPPLTDINV